MEYFDYFGQVPPPQKDTTATMKKMPSLHVQVQAKLYYGLKTRKFRKYKQVENIAVHLQNMTTYYVKYGKEEDRIKAMIGLKQKRTGKGGSQRGKKCQCE